MVTSHIVGAKYFYVSSTAIVCDGHRIERRCGISAEGCCWTDAEKDA